MRTSQRNKTSIISNNKKEKEEPIKKEELFESQFEAPVFFNEQQEPPKKGSAFSKASSFRNVAENNPIFDTSQLNKAFSNNLAGLDLPDPNNPPALPNFPEGKSAFKQEKVSQNVVLGQGGILGQGGVNQNNPPSLPVPQQNGQLGGFSVPTMQVGGMGGGFNNSIYDNLMYSNLMLSNWLGSVKSNNNSLYDGMMNHSLVDQLMHKTNL